MPYHAWREFSRQQISLFIQAYGNAPSQHTHWTDHDMMLPGDAALLQGLDPWMHNTGAGVQIDTNGIHQELLLGIQEYGALLERLLPTIPPIFRTTATAAVLYDASRDKLYYGTSGFVASMLGMRLHPTLAGREQQLPVNLQGIRTLVGNRHARTCAEFKALNRALLDGAQEHDLAVWAFRVRQMTPMPQCANCRVTMPRQALARHWTG